MKPQIPKRLKSLKCACGVVGSVKWGQPGFLGYVYGEFRCACGRNASCGHPNPAQVYEYIKRKIQRPVAAMEG